jgi:hypothetical protein
MKTFFQFLEDIGTRRDYEEERIRRQYETPDEKEVDPTLWKLTKFLNMEIRKRKRK